MYQQVEETKYNIEQAAKKIGISPSGVRALLDTEKLGFYQAGKRRVIGEGHINDYLTKINRNDTKARIN